MGGGVVIAATDGSSWVCNGCQADEYACANKASNGGRLCCPGCTHIQIRKIEPAVSALGVTPTTKETP